MQEPPSVRQKRTLMPYCAGAVSRQCRQRRRCAGRPTWAVEADIALTKLHLEMATVRGRLMAGSFPSKPPSGNLLLPAPYFHPNRHSSLVRDRQFPRTDLKNIRSGTPATIRLMSDTAKPSRVKWIRLATACYRMTRPGAGRPAESVTVY